MRSYGMKLPVLIVGEIVLLLASVLVFRSAWTLIDLYFGYSHTEIMLIIGIFITVVSLFVLNNGMKQKTKGK